jgi:hypothetical protein
MLSRIALEKEIESIVDCAFSWRKDDNDRDEIDDPEWDEAIAVIRVAPRFLELCEEIVQFQQLYKQGEIDQEDLDNARADICHQFTRLSIQAREKA